MIMEESKTGKIMDYIRENFSLNCDAQRLLEAALFHTVDNRPSGSVGLLRSMLYTVGMSSDEVNSIVQGKVPSRPMISVPVYARLNTSVLTWVKVSEGAGKDEIERAAIKNIVDGNFDYDDDWETDEDDIDVYNVDSDGAQEVEEDE